LADGDILACNGILHIVRFLGPATTPASVSSLRFSRERERERERERDASACIRKHQAFALAPVPSFIELNGI